MRIYDDITKLVGNTPILHLQNTEKNRNLKAKIFAKLEYFNPAGSVKDRVALNMIKEAEKAGLLKEGGTIIETTSGNTGIGLAAMGRALGYEAIIVMPESMSEERRKLVKAYGAQLVLSPAAKGMKGAIEKAEEIQANSDNAVILGQFTNYANPAAHKQTAKEIFEDMEGKVDIVVMGVGTGGTITGVGETLKAQIPNVKIVAVEPEGSPVLSGGDAGSHKIQGIGAGFVPAILNTSIYDEIIKIGDGEALEMLKTLAASEGILLGISSAAAVLAAKKLAEKPENAGKNILAICPDTGERYLSLF